MSVIDRGKEENERQRREQREREGRWREENRRHTISRFRMDFYREHYIEDPDPYAYPRIIEDPGNPIPEVTEWRAIGPGDTRADSTFVCEGLRYIVRWKYHGGGDRAYWDDGWWPDWFLVLPRFGLPFLKREVEVYGPASIARALGR